MAKPHTDPAPPRDIIDFHLRWSEFKPAALDAVSRLPEGSAQRMAVAWLTLLADRVSDADLRIGGDERAEQER